MIKTTKRYAVSKSLLQIFFFSVEYFFVFGRLLSHAPLKNFLLLYGGYLLMVCLFVVRGHTSKVYLKYEVGLSVLVKTLTTNAVVVLFFAALPDVGIRAALLAVATFTVLNLITLFFINMLGKIYIRRDAARKKKMLYIYDEGEKSNDTRPHGKGTWISASLPTKDIEAMIDEHDVVYLVDVHSQQRNSLMKICYDKNKLVFITAKLSDVLIKASGVTQDVDTPVYYCERFGISRASAFLKRCFDIVFSLLALIVLSPLFLIVALLIKLEDGGPVIYRQTRCTKDQKEFSIYKFRSMAYDSEREGIRLSSENDERVTHIGKCIRFFKIDELPQLINILKGEMSIVGPRPERPELIKEAIKEIPEFTLRMKVKAGLTGYAQVRGYYNTAFLDKLKWDLMYIENYSFLLDIKIVIMTAFVLFQRNMRNELIEEAEEEDS